MVLLYALDLFGTAVFAASGALAAGRKHLDLFGVLVVAAVTAVGGGTVRDLLLDRHPVFWIGDTTYLAVIAGAALLTFFYTRRFEPPRSALAVADALGLAVFTIIGAQVATQAGAPPAVVVLMGMTTGTVGGVIRDMLCGDVPLILRQEIYATASLGGGVVYVLAGAFLVPTAQLLAASSVVLIARGAGIWWHLRLPAYRLGDDDAGPENSGRSEP
jgi:uncharacterized membrane protein YeiH